MLHALSLGNNNKTTKPAPLHEHFPGGKSGSTLTQQPHTKQIHIMVICNGCSSEL